MREAGLPCRKALRVADLFCLLSDASQAMKDGSRWQRCPKPHSGQSAGALQQSLPLERLLGPFAAYTHRYLCMSPCMYVYIYIAMPVRSG